MLADAGNGYTWEGICTPGRRGIRETGLADRVILDLVDDVRLQGKGYVIVTDNFYSSPSLFRELLRRRFGACGTARKNRRGLP